MPEAYDGCLEFLYGRLNYERLGMPSRSGLKELRLDRIRWLLKRLGDPQKQYGIIHLAGTKGKGSTAALIASVLKTGGHRVGLFTSPHLHRFEERFTIDGEAIASDELVLLVEMIKPLVAESDARLANRSDRGLTFFEITTAMGLLYFARSGCRVVVLEVGMGGRLDSTNAIRPIVSVITSISLDHTRQLGNTLGQIATEKAGIIKRGRPVVSGVLEPEPREAIRWVARQRKSRLREIDIDFKLNYQPPILPLERPTNGEALVRTWRSERGTLRLPLPLPGEHQAKNVAVAVATLEAIGEIDPSLLMSSATIQEGIRNVRWPARVEIVGTEPWTIIDGAHNVASAAALAETLLTCFPVVPRTLIFSTSRDKDAEGQLEALLPLFDQVVVTQYIENPRAIAPATLAGLVGSLSSLKPVLAADPSTALQSARSVTPQAGLIVVTGSLFLAAEARAQILGIRAVQAFGRLLT